VAQILILQFIDDGIVQWWYSKGYVTYSRLCRPCPSGDRGTANNDAVGSDAAQSNQNDKDSYMTSRTSNSQPPGETTLTRSESAARGALEAVASRAFTDVEWERARIRVLEFVAILLEWDRQTDTSAPRADNVVMLPDPAQTRESRLDKAA
jgi:hypothetical protein